VWSRSSARPRGRGEAIEPLIINVLLAMMACAVVALIAQRNLFAVVVLSGIYSFLMATVLVALDAVDVAMTEASVGAGISTVLLLGALYLVGSQETKPMHRPWPPLAIAAVTGGMLVYGTLGLPAFSDPDAPIHRHVAKRYIEEGARDTGVPNIVTAVLASYRGYDTLGETTVVFTAGAGVIALLRRRRKSREEGK
jgi:multicomponent Na+:H+ antiporter subunit B